MKILPTETLLTGKWLLKDGRLVADEVCNRISELTTCHLRELSRDPSGWDVLYRDPDDGRLWELVFPESDLHGGGPPELRHIFTEQAKEKYGDVVSTLG